MNRETREGVIRAQIIAHEQIHDEKVVEREELIKLICDAEEEQEKRDAHAKFNETSRAIADLAHRPR